MVRAVVPRIQGDEYQSRWLWMQICRLFEERSKVERIVYEDDGIKYFDDVTTIYAAGMCDEDGNALSSDHYQVKFHVAMDGALTADALMDPNFINAKSTSILQRLQAVQRLFAPGGIGTRFYVYSPWVVHPDDPLATIASNADGRIRWHDLGQGGAKSVMGKIRAAWRTHLAINTDDELRTVLRPLRLRVGPTMDEVRDHLNLRLRQAGFVPVPPGVISHPYDELTRKLLQAGRTSFNRSEIKTIAECEGLWQGSAIPEPDAERLGIRSFFRWAEQLEDETDHMLCLLDLFNDRKAKIPELWQAEIMPKLEEFLHLHVRPGGRYHLHLHAHTSIAFATGYSLDTKCGADVVPVQSTLRGRELWRPWHGETAHALPDWLSEENLMPGRGRDVAVALSVTHDIHADVSMYVSHALPAVGRIVHLTVPTAPGSQAIQDGGQAQSLASQVSNYLKATRTPEERRGVLHIFAAAPNGLMFFLGQVARGWGGCTLYEYGFEDNSAEGYEPSLSFPSAR